MTDWILVVDDDVANLKMASRILISENMRVSCLKSGEEAVKFLHGNRPDLILLDLHMPGMDGFEILRRLRGQKIETPVVMLTARAEVTDRVRGLDAGADYYLTKPFENEEFLACLRAVLRRPEAASAIT